MKTMTDTKDILVECIQGLFEDRQVPQPEEIADTIIKTLGLEQEWAVAEYDADGGLDRVTYHDWDFDAVYRAYGAIQKAMENKNFRGSVGIVSRLFTHWSKV